MFNPDKANETDVREDLASPFLAALGYARGTENNIDRELTLRYDYHYLGRKKAHDRPIVGRADYVLSVLAAARWTFEIKAPNQPLDNNAIEQAISYARHPEVAAHYAVLTNGLDFLVFQATARADSQPLAHLAVTTPQQLADELQGLLGPDAIRRDCSLKPVDLNKPIAPGLRSTAILTGGTITYDEVAWESSLNLPQLKPQFDEVSRILTGFKSHLTTGNVRRDDNSRIIAQLEWAVPHEKLQQFQIDKGFAQFQYVALSDTLSTDVNNPTVFDFAEEINLAEGEEIFHPQRWETQTLGATVAMLMTGTGAGYYHDNTFEGTFNVIYQQTVPAVPGLVVYNFFEGRFEFSVDAN